MRTTIPAEIEADIKRAVRLEMWTIAWMISIITLIGLTMGSSQAMKTAWIEDILSLVPALVFLLALHFERKKPNARFPYGYHRFNSLAFLVSAVALASMGALLLFESLHALVKAEHVTIPPVELFGRDVWLGWLMIAALLYSVIPPVILGRMKLPVARRLQDEVLHTDALMQKADWMTGLAGIAGILGIGLGYWWADAAAAGIISASILKDGLTSLAIAVAELADGAPRELGSTKLEREAAALKSHLLKLYPGSEVRLRESGRFIQAQVCGIASPGRVDLDDLWPGPPERSWRLAQLSFAPPHDEEAA